MMTKVISRKEKIRPGDIIKKTAEMSKVVGGEYALTNRDVPIIIIQFKCNKHPHSFCYMAKRGVWRGFYPYCRKGQSPITDTQAKKDFATNQELISFVAKKRKALS